MSAIIISIHKKYSDQLFNGTKNYEFRKSIPKKPITSLLVYEARGCGMIVGELGIDKVLAGTPQEIWKLTKDSSGIKEEDFFRYFSGRDKAFAYVIGSRNKYEVPKNLEEFGVNYPPQNYIWWNE